MADKLFYPSSDTDTDTLITPTPTGVEIFFQLRSPDAPTANAIDVDVPAARPSSRRPRAAPRSSTAPRRWSRSRRRAPGTRRSGRSPSTTRIAGSELTVVAEIDDDSTLWPVVIDPIIDYYPWGDTSPRRTRT